MTAYLLHFEPAYQHARHYLGYTSRDVEERINEHVRATGNGARLVQVVLEAGHHVMLARVWEGEGRDFEKHLKRQHNTPRLCPICQRRAT